MAHKMKQNNTFSLVLCMYRETANCSVSYGKLLYPLEIFDERFSEKATSCDMIASLSFVPDEIGSFLLFFFLLVF